jgi:hypothetical protein
MGIDENFKLDPVIMGFWAQTHTHKEVGEIMKMSNFGKPMISTVEDKISDT